MTRQEEFEAEVVRDAGKHGMLCDLSKDSSGRYRSACERSAWWAWQASRQALVIELPDEQPMYMYYAPDVLAVIEAAGLKVKP